MKLNIPRPGLQLKIVAWSFIPAAIILLGVALLSIFLLQVVIEALMIDNNRETTELMAEQIGGELAALADQLEDVARTPDLSGEDVSAQRAALHRAAPRLESFDGGVVVLNPQGRIVAAEPARQDSPQDDWSDRPYFRQMVGSPGTIWSDIHTDNAGDTLVVSLAVPITAADGRFLGALAGMFRADSTGTGAFYRRLAPFRTWPGGGNQDLVSPGPLKSTFLVDHNGRIVFHTEASRIGRDLSSESAVRAVLAGARGPIRSADYRGNNVITYFAPVPHTGWGFLVEQQHSAVLDFYDRYFLLQTFLFALALIVPAGLVAFGVRRITGPIRQVTTASRQMAAGDLQQVIHVRTGDELEELANQFNRMSAQLRESYRALKERGERLALVVRATNDGIWDWDLQTNQVYFSPRWKSMLGYADDELGITFDDWRRLIHADDVDRALTLVQDYIQGKTSTCEVEHRLQHKDGSYRWVLARGVVLRDGSGHPYRMVGSHTDITEHQREQALQAGQRQFLELLATGGDFSETLHTLVRIIEDQWRGMLGLILLLDEDGKHLHIGASVTLPQDYVDSIEGLEIGPLVGSCGTACYRRERVIVEDILTDPRWEGLRSLAVRYGLRACWSEPVIASDGQVVGTFAMYYRQPRAPTVDELRTIETAAHLVGIAIEHRRTLEALRRSEMRFRAVFEGAPIGIRVTSWDPGTTDWQEHKIEVNRAYQQILGYTGEELARMQLEEYSHPADALIDRALYAELLEAKREGYQIEKRYIAKDGRVFWGRYSASIVRGPQAQPQLMIGMVENIEDRKRAEQALQAAYQTLERRVEERTRELATLNSVAAVVSRSLDLKEIMKDALAHTVQVYGMDTGAAYELEENTRTLALVAEQGLSEDFVRNTTRLPLELVLAGRALDVEHPMSWHVESDYPEGALKESIRREGLQSIFGVPLTVRGKLVGALVVSSKKHRALTYEEAALLSAVGQQIGVAVENAHLYQRATQVAAMAERSRLARELHDSVTQSLYSVMLYAEAAVRSLADDEVPEASDYLKELRDTAQNALREMRLLIFELRPLALEKNGLVAALRTRLNAVEGRGGMATELCADDNGQVEELPLALQEELYHIAQEALNNVIRHAHAQRVAVRLQLSEGAVHLEIADDGIGFDPSRADESSGLGLRGMRERVQRVGGTVEIESVAGKGTRVKAQVPRGSRAHENTVAGGAP